MRQKKKKKDCEVYCDLNHGKLKNYVSRNVDMVI